MPHATTSTRVDARTPAQTVTRTRNATINHAVSNKSNRTMTQSTPKQARRTLTHALQGAYPSDAPRHHVDTRRCAHTSPNSHTYTQCDNQSRRQQQVKSNDDTIHAQPYRLTAEFPENVQCSAENVPLPTMSATPPCSSRMAGNNT